MNISKHSRAFWIRSPIINPLQSIKKMDFLLLVTESGGSIGAMLTQMYFSEAMQCDLIGSKNSVVIFIDDGFTLNENTSLKSSFVMYSPLLSHDTFFVIIEFSTFVID